MGEYFGNNMATKKKPDEEEEVEEDPGPPPVEEGNGVFIFPDSTKFDGQWQKGGELGEDFRRHGQGTHIDGEQSYEGQWCNDAMHGQGTFRYASNAVYEGLWAANQYEGEGKYSWPNGASYTGAWVASRMHGKGEYIDEKGVTWQGRFYNGVGPGLSAAVLSRCILSHQTALFAAI